MVNWTLRNKLQWYFNRNSNIFIQENAFEIVVCEMASICLSLNVLQQNFYNLHQCYVNLAMRCQSYIWYLSLFIILGRNENSISWEFCSSATLPIGSVWYVRNLCFKHGLGTARLRFIKSGNVFPLKPSNCCKLRCEGLLNDIHQCWILNKYFILP